MSQTPNPHLDSQTTIIARVRRAGIKFAQRLTANAARWVIGWSLGLTALYLSLTSLTLVPVPLLPTVLTLLLALLLEAFAAVALVADRFREPRRGLRIAVIGLLICTVVLTIVTATDSSRQHQRATARCLATVAAIASSSTAAPHASPWEHEVISDLGALGHALCEQMAAASA